MVVRDHQDCVVEDPGIILDLFGQALQGITRTFEFIPRKRTIKYSDICANSTANIELIHKTSLINIIGMLRKKIRAQCYTYVNVSHV